MKILFIVLAVCITLPIIFALFIFLGAKASNSAYKKINAELSDSYFSKEGKIYYSTGGNLTFVGAYELHGSDADTFRVLGRTVAVDKDRIYFGKVFLAATRKSYEDIDENELSALEAHPDLLAANTNDLELYFYTHSKTGKKLQSTFLTDTKQVFTHSQLVEDAKPEDFKAMSYSYGYDQKQVYYNDTILQPYEGQNIRVEHTDWESDILFLGHTVFIGPDHRDDIDAASYKTIADKHSVDKNTAYFERKPIEGSEPSSYQTFKNSDYYSKDDLHVYFSGIKLHNADPHSFKLYGEYGEVAADKDHFYIRDVQVLNQKPGVDFRLSPTSMDSYKYQTLLITDNTALVVRKNDLKEVEDNSSIVVYDNQVYDRFRGILQGADPADIKPIDLNNRYTASAGKLYYEATEMKGVDPDSCTIYPFESHLSFYAETPKYLYYLGKQIKVNGAPYERNEVDGTLQTFEGNNLVCNNRYCFSDENLVLELNPDQAPNITYDDMENYSLEEN